ncbi:hypothetical protein [Sorangium atrum]|uniref:Uncharacterized protein n=1 Tax=Sorangium atrum TaxID=2995308 RepID=A0ABT5C6U4_9BACT|nr:hypothetical protein [Sorangium aterium]MDC0681550.1 hypothetical protein [Sorangium aterium]
MPLSLVEHVVARSTRKFKIPKGFHTLRNKKMRAEKLFFLHWPEARRFLGLVVTCGNGKLIERILEFVRAVRRGVQVRQLRLIIEAGASATNEGLRRLDHFGKIVFLIRAPRRPGYVDAWKRLPRARFTPYEEPGRYKG